ncbi:MAG: GNAT family N-acetyltransferase [Porticoccaceae bacterium]|jgi:GNAT superfamily N-acetyltransferase|nr:GNAT family N-acetyltransferase [Porticoccaceae bacterium]MDG1311867.1 GNAT family N-acetyltransferase [Porticoccaceae bacterium]
MLKIRTASPEDASLIMSHNCAMALETEGKVLDPEAAIAGVEGLFKRPQFGFYLVAEVDGLPAATLMVTYEWSDWRNGLFWWIQSVYVASEFRRQGIYRAMYFQLQFMAKASSIPVCGFRLYAETENHNAQATYKDCGMKVCDYIMFEQGTG